LPHVQLAIIVSELASSLSFYSLVIVAYQARRAFRIQNKQ